MYQPGILQRSSLLRQRPDGIWETRERPPDMERDKGTAHRSARYVGRSFSGFWVAESDQTRSGENRLFFGGFDQDSMPVDDRRPTKLQVEVETSLNNAENKAATGTTWRVVAQYCCGNWEFFESCRGMLSLEIVVQTGFPENQGHEFSGGTYARIPNGLLRGADRYWLRYLFHLQKKDRTIACMPTSYRMLDDRQVLESAIFTWQE